MDKNHEIVDELVAEIQSLVDIEKTANTVTPGVKNIKPALGVKDMERVCAIAAQLYGNLVYERIFSERYPNEHFRLQKYR